MYFDMPVEELERYKPTRNEPQDFDVFWEGAVQASQEYALDLQLKEVVYGLAMLKTYDVTFSGYGGQPVKAWFIHPDRVETEMPCVVNYIGYGGGRGYPTDWLLWASAGYATLVMDTRGQGSTWLQGDTPDIPDVGSSPHIPGFMTLGILDPSQYYYLRVFVDAVRAVEAARGLPGVDPEKIAVTGRSQGGGITLAVSGLVHDLAAVMPDVPFLCHFKRAVSITDSSPYSEIQGFCKTHRDRVPRVFQTLSYFDGMHFAARANAPALFSTGLMDTICPPSTVYAAYNHYAGSRSIRAYDFNEHDGGGSHHELEQVSFLRDVLAG